MKKVYTEQEIKEAFWEMFFKSGEWWFGETDVLYSEDAVRDAWENFLEILDEEMLEL